MDKIDAVFFISFGGPEKKEDIRPFLEIVTRGRRIPPERIDEVAHHYEVIGGRSPINGITNRQAEALQQLLNAGFGTRNAEEGSAFLKKDSPSSVLACATASTPHSALPVYVGNRNWHPFIEDTLRKMAAAGIKHAIGFPTTAHRTEASWERYLNAVETARQKIGPSAPTITYIEPWFDHPLFIEAISERVKEALQSAECRTQKDTSLHSAICDLRWVFTAHSIPTPMAQASRYVQELEATAALVSIRFGVKNWRLAYTSRSGAPTDPWLEPDVCDAIQGLSKEGVRDVLTIPIGFVADHVEVLFDLDVEAKEAADKVGIRFHRAETVGDHPLFIQMIADVINRVHSSSASFSPSGRRQG